MVGRVQDRQGFDSSTRLQLVEADLDDITEVIQKSFAQIEERVDKSLHNVDQRVVWVQRTLIGLLVSIVLISLGAAVALAFPG